MDITFKSKKLSNICNSSKELNRQYGPHNAKKIMMRLNELRSVDNLSLISTLPPPRCHELSGNRKNQFAVDIVHPTRLTFKPAVDQPPTSIDGRSNLHNIKKIVVLDVEDYHG